MRVPLEWLKAYVTVRLKPTVLADRLTMAGLEVTGIDEVNGEPVLELEVTPNRADCLSIVGVAREVAAITGQRLKLPQRQATGDRRQASRKTPHPTPHTPHPIIRIEDRRGCQRYIGRLIEGVRVGPSPDWMQHRLIACGARAINNIVDITNYVLLEYGQPLHAFDYERLARDTILVRRARAGEVITTLDGVRRTLPRETLVIADAKQPVAVAGIVGGTGSEVTQTTRTVLLESALFDPIAVRRTARALGLATESSYRFERGVDPMGVDTASARAAELILSLAGGRLRVVRDVGAQPSRRAGIALDVDRVNRWLGTRLSPGDLRTTLAKLSCRVAASERTTTLRVFVPSFRRDLTTDVDLAEELARSVGYDQIPASLPVAPLAVPRAETAAYWRLQSLRCLCASLGLTETINWALVSAGDLAQCGYSQDHAIRLANPISQDHAFVRPSLLMGLLQATRRNLTQGATSVRLFEVGSISRPGASVLEEPRLGIMLSGIWSRDWCATQPCDFFRLKGLLEALLSHLCTGTVRLQVLAHPWAEPGQGTTVTLNGRPVGVAAQVSCALTHALDLTPEVWFAELSVNELLKAPRAVTAMHLPTQFPPVKRDLSVVVGNGTPFEQVDRAIREAAGTLAARIELVDRYTGPQVPAGKHSLTFSIEYRDASRTLTAGEVDALHQRVGQTLASRFGAQLR